MSLERYRPKHINEVLGQTAATNLASRLVVAAKEKGYFPHLLFHGPPGTGKTTLALALMADVLGEAVGENSFELNASDERGLDVVREKIKPWVGQMPRDAPFKLLL
ncbi:replication factor C small subunit, partial [mine drainage metagenome]